MRVASVAETYGASLLAGCSDQRARTARREVFRPSRNPCARSLFDLIIATHGDNTVE